LQTLENITQFPNELLKLSQESLSDMRGGIITNPRSNVLPQINPYQDIDPTTELHLSPESIPANTIPLEPDPTESIVVGIDTSNIDLGETSNGILFAIRGTTVWAQGHRYYYTRYGPYIILASEKNKQTLYNNFIQGLLLVKQTYKAPDQAQLPNAFRSVFERAIQRTTCEQFRDSIILWDGPLTVWTADPTYYAAQRVLLAARERGNTIMGLSKHTTLFIGGRCITSLVDDGSPPCMIPVRCSSPLGEGESAGLLGRVYAAKLARGSCTFRLDIDRTLTEEERVKGVRRLIGNDLVIESYPETLRLAHIFSRFNAMEVIGLQRYVSEFYKLRISKRPDIRQIIFGPFSGRQGIMEGPTYDAFV
jgi:hypothetical protein